jgi:hypothetical protein
MCAENKATYVFSLWVEGYEITGQASPARCLGPIEGTSFSAALKTYVDSLPPESRAYWTARNSQWSYWGCRAFDNELDARRAFG